MFEGQRELHLCIFLAENQHVTIPTTALVTDNLSIFHDSSLAVDTDLYLIIIKDDALTFAFTLREEEGAAVLCDWSCGNPFSRNLLGFCLLLTLYGSNAVLFCHCLKLFAARLTIPTETNHDEGNENESCNCVFIHMC